MEYILKCIRIFNDETINIASVKIGISQSYMSEIENGRKPPSLNLIERYSNIYGLPIHRLFKLKESLKGVPKKHTKPITREFMILLMAEMLNTPTSKQ